MRQPARYVLCLLLLLSPGWVRASSSALEQQLNHALDVYLEGDLMGSREALLQLLAHPDIDGTPYKVQALLYLGEVQYMSGEREASWSTFLSLLLEQPELQVDPFAHPPEIVSFVESVREYAKQLRPLPLGPPEPQPAPSTEVSFWIASLPGGLQFHHGDTTLGYVLASGTALLGSSTLLLRSYLVGMDLDEEQFGLQVATGDAYTQARRARILQNCVGGLGLGLWGGGVFWGLKSQGREQRAD